MKASIVVMSHLSDAQEQNRMGNSEAIRSTNVHINFAKYVILQTGGDLTKEIDPDIMWDEFLAR
jgi:hypothetical protein